MLYRCRLDHGSSTLLTDIGLAIIFAAAASHLARVLKQPLILGYVLGGILLGGHVGFGLVSDEMSIETISEMGLILLLFIIGLEIKLRDLARMGKAMFVLGVAQFFGCVVLGLAYFQALGFDLGVGNYDVLYGAVAMALSSTLIVVKLLHDKFETGSVAGRLTLGILVLQDIWAIIFMALQPNLLEPQLTGILMSFFQGALLVGVVFLASRFLLAHLFKAAGKQPELVLLSSIAWCFAVCGLAERAGLSREMGALIAGISIAAFPYGTDVIAKLAGVRDFFVTLFFVSLGLKVPIPSLGVLAASAAAVVFVVASRVAIVVPTTHLVGIGMRTGLVTALNLAQVSEFSLVILALGAGYGHISPALQTFVLTTMLLASVVSTYLIMFNDRLARSALHLFAAVGIRERRHAPSVGPDNHHAARDIVLLGCFRVGEALLETIEREAPDLKERLLVIDYNPALGPKLEAKGFKWVYGDLAHPQTLHHLGIEHAAVVISSISDTFLKGTNNRRLVSHVREIAPKARLVMMADDAAQAELISREGAETVVIPPQLAGAHVFTLLRDMIDS